MYNRIAVIDVSLETFLFGGPSPGSPGQVWEVSGGVRADETEGPVWAGGSWVVHGPWKAASKKTLQKKETH